METKSTKIFWGWDWISVAGYRGSSREKLGKGLGMLGQVMNDLNLTDKSGLCLH